MTYQTLRFMGREKLTAAGILNAEGDARELLLGISGMNATEYAMNLGKEASAEEEQKYKEAVSARCMHVPLQQILGFAYFAGRKFYVNRHVLIPRLDTEVLVRSAEKRIRPGMKILDIGTGSGCILLTVLLDCPGTEGTGLDISEEALKVARINAENLQVKARFIQSDLFANAEGTYDIIISNPPYIESKVIETLDEEVKCFEPLLSLDGWPDGLHFYRKIMQDAGRYLKEGGCIAFEIGEGQAESVRSIMRSSGFENLETIQDLSGKDRVIIGGK